LAAAATAPGNQQPAACTPAPANSVAHYPKGGREKKNDESDVHLGIWHLPQRQKKSSYLLYFIFIFIFIFYRFFFKGVFWAFRNKGSSKTRKKKHEKSISAHHKKCCFFFLRFFFPSLGFFVRFFFYRVFGRSMTRGVQKRHKKKSRENLLSFQKKYLLLLLTSLFFFFPRVP
jgi:hypothetical protein